MGEKRYYFDTSIWLDFLENRNEPNMPKGEWAKKLVSKIVNNDDIILFSDVNMLELNDIGYSQYDIDEILKPINHILLFIEAEAHQVGKAIDIAKRRNVPKRDALHAILARDNYAILVTFDAHFKELADITKTYTSKDLI